MADDQATVWGVMDGSTYRMLRARQTQLAEQGAEIMSKRIVTQNPEKISKLDQAMAANEAAKSQLAEASGHYNVIAEQVRKYSYGKYNPPSMSVGGVSGMSGLGIIPVAAYEVIVAVLAVTGVVAAIYAMTSLIANMDKNINAASNFLAQANRLPDAIASGASGVVSAASAGVDVLGKAALYGGIGFAVYLGYQALKKRGQV